MCMDAYLCASVCVNVYVCVYVHMHVEAQYCWAASLMNLQLTLRQGPWLSLEFTVLASLASQLSPGIPCLLLTPGITGRQPPPGFYLGS